MLSKNSKFQNTCVCVYIGVYTHTHTYTTYTVYIKFKISQAILYISWKYIFYLEVFKERHGNDKYEIQDGI